MIGPLPATQRGTVLAGVNAKPCGWPAASVDPGCGRHPSNPPPEPGSKNGPRTKIRQSEVSTLSGDGREDVIAGVLAFHARRRDGDPAALPAAGYRVESLQILFGENTS